MSPDPDDSSGTGLASSFGWAIGAAAGTILVGLVMWVDPEVFSTAIPALYGIESGRTVGWLLHVVLGLVVDFLVTRGPILGTVFAPVVGVSDRSTPDSLEEGERATTEGNR